jgi:hypothetical protein
MDYPAEIFDQVQWRYETNGFNDHQLHCVLRFEAGRNASAARRSRVGIAGAVRQIN